MNTIRLEKARKVETKSPKGSVNGFLTELYKDGERTIAYLSAALPGTFKGYHLHKVRSSRYVCIKGMVKVTIYQWCEIHKNWTAKETTLTGSDPHRLFIPSNMPTGIEVLGDEEAWIINYPDPAHDPRLKGEQVEYTLEELQRGVLK